MRRALSERAVGKEQCCSITSEMIGTSVKEPPRFLGARLFLNFILELSFSSLARAFCAP